MGELFSGPGGIALAADLASKQSSILKKVEIIHAWANDFDKDTCDTYKNNIVIEKEHVHCEDIRKLDISKLGPIDALSFGFPCNDYSVVGEQKGMQGSYGPLYSYGISILKSHSPQWFFAENVSGLRNTNDGQDFKRILEEMFKAGYDVFPNLYKFEEYGVPQSRHRIIIVGFKKELNLEFKIPAPLYKIKTCKDAIETPPILNSATNNEPTVQSLAVIERLKHIKPGENAFTADLPDNLKLNVKGAKISQIYRRLDSNKPAYTLTGSGGGGTHMYHWSENRALTNRERARIQTFPDEYTFYGSKESVRKQIGMAVPPCGAMMIFEAIFKTLQKVEYESIEPSMPPLLHNMDESLIQISKGEALRFEGTVQ
jgi:DNA-methyltransferase (dcm)